MKSYNLLLEKSMFMTMMEPAGSSQASVDDMPTALVSTNLTTDIDRDSSFTMQGLSLLY